jgi:thiol:disulfide interchange protein DsbD
VSITLPVHRGESPPPASTASATIEATKRSVPINAGWTAQIAKPDEELRLDITAPGLDSTRITEVRFFPEEWGMLVHAAPQTLIWREDGFTIKLRPGDLTRSPPETLTGVIVVTEKSYETSLRNGFLITEIPSNLDGRPCGPCFQSRHAAMAVNIATRWPRGTGAA